MIPLVAPSVVGPIDPNDTIASAAVDDEYKVTGDRLLVPLPQLITALAPNATGKPLPALTLFAGLCLLTRTAGSLPRLVTALPVATQLDGAAVVQAMANLGLHAARSNSRRLRKPRPGRPILVITDRRCAVVFASVSGPRVLDDTGTIVDAAALLQAPETATATLFEFIPDSVSHPLSARRREHTRHGWLQALLSKFYPAAGALSVISLLMVIAEVLLPILSIAIYTQTISLASVRPLPGLAVGMLILIWLEWRLLKLRTKIIAWVASRMEFLISTSTFGHILALRPTMSERSSPVDQVSRIRSFENIREFITGPSFSPLLDLPVAVTSVLVIALLAGGLAVVPLTGILVLIGIFITVGRSVAVATRAAADDATDMQRIYVETFEKRAAIRDAGLQAQWSERIGRAARADQGAQNRLRMIVSVGESLATFVLTASIVLLFSACTQRAWAGQIDLGLMLAVVILGVRAMAPFHVACLSIGRFEQIRNSARQIEALMNVEVEANRGSDRRVDLGGNISLLNVGFRSGDTRPVFFGLDLEITCGDVIAVTGTNGSGKSTLLKMLHGLSDVSLGAIRIDGIDLRQVDPQDMRRSVSYVPQHPKLLPGSLRDNLCYAKPHASDDSIARALELVDLTEAVAALPGGIDHELTPRSIAELTTTFLYKFALAQAVITNGKVILIDEIPNDLYNGKVGEVISRLLSTARGRRTVIFATHRSDFIAKASRVVLMQYGRVPVVATPKDVLSRVA
ncbi:ATP-binding cassette domain-containing protein [Rhodopseudomonas sp. BR0M22]|nr:ATP-binding cassette domain-containing protein [Rhodopseudomonas sp. BR0M22]